MGAYRINDKGRVYFQIRGPAGRTFPSGLSAYTFDSHGRFIGWTEDDGDFPSPGLTSEAEYEPISLDELKRSAL